MVFSVGYLDAAKNNIILNNIKGLKVTTGYDELNDYLT